MIKYIKCIYFIKNSGIRHFGIFAPSLLALIGVLSESYSMHLVRGTTILSSSYVRVTRIDLLKVWKEFFLPFPSGTFALRALFLPMLSNFPYSSNWSAEGLHMWTDRRSGGTIFSEALMAAAAIKDGSQVLKGGGLRGWGRIRVCKRRLDCEAQ